MKIETHCKRCGGGLVLDLPDDVAADPGMRQIILERLVPSMVHDRCYEELVEKDAALVVMDRMAEWTRVCPAAFQDTDVNRLPMQSAFLKVMAWAAGPMGLLLHGPTGIGKTRSAWRLLEREFKAGKVVFGLSHGELCGNAAALLHKQGEQMERWLKLLKSVDVLLVDDLGKAKMMGPDGVGRFSEEILSDVFDARIARKLPTVFTTMFTQKEIMSGMSAERGEPFVRRLKEFCNVILFTP